MTRSMTAFARVQRQLDEGNLSWELRSVNHRYLELSFRMPEAFRFLESSLRAEVRGTLSRGKLECQLKFQEGSGTNQTLRINPSLVQNLIEIGNSLATQHNLANDLTLSSVLNWPGVIDSTAPDLERLKQQIEESFQEALTQLVKARESEGQGLQAHIQKRLNQLREEVDKARQEISSHPMQVKEKLLTRLNNLQVEVDSSRIEQEVALFLTRMDVSEELDRLQTHTVEVSKLLKSFEPAGRHLDFLMQELNREANTLSSKSDFVNLTQIAVEMKVLIEQMREQIQNIE